MRAAATRLGGIGLFALLGLPSVAFAEPSAEQPAWQSAPSASSSSSVPEASEDVAEGPGEEEEEEDSSDEVDANPFSSLPKDSVEGSLSRVLSEPEAAFCKAHHAAFRHDSLLCSLSQLSVRQRCPGLREACSNKPTEQLAKPPSSLLAGLADLSFWLVLAGLVALLGLALRRMLVAAHATPNVAPKRPSSSSPSNATTVARHVAETDVARLWSLAEESALAARFEEAVAALQAALIHALRISGKLHVSPAQTNGDYLRALRGEPSLHGPARDVFRSVEAVQFGGAQATPELYRKLLERVQPIVLRVLSMLVLCVCAFSQGGCAPSLDADPEASAQGLGCLPGS